MFEDIKPEQIEEIKKIISDKLTKETGEKITPEDILIEPKDKNSFVELTPKDKYKYIFNKVDFEHYDEPDLKYVRYIYGRCIFINSKVRNLGDLEYINGDARFYISAIDDLNKLKRIEGDVDFNTTGIKSLKNLESIGGFLYIKDCYDLVDLGELKSIDGYLYVGDGCNLRSLKNVEYIGSNLHIENSLVNDLGNLKYVGGELFLNYQQELLFSDRIYKDEDGIIRFKNDENYVAKYNSLKKEDDETLERE